MTEKIMLIQNKYRNAFIIDLSTIFLPLKGTKEMGVIANHTPSRLMKYALMKVWHMINPKIQNVLRLMPIHSTRNFARCVPIQKAVFKHTILIY
jgi:hypothetical protein